MKAHVAATTATIGSGDNEEPANIPPLFSTEEMRHMISFGRHPPVFATTAVPIGGIEPVGQDPDPKVDAYGQASAGTEDPEGSDSA
jgi:hypothetical protein